MELREWQYMNTPTASSNTTSAASTSSTGYKKRFEKLIKYHIDHASSELESITRKDISDRYFRLSEHYNDGSKEFDRSIIVAVDKSTEEFEIHIFIDHEEVESIQRKGYENFVAAIEPYMFLPDSGTQEYDDLLVEWVAMKNNSNTSPASFKNRLKKLYDYVVKHADKRFVERVELETLTDDTLRYVIYSTSLMSKVETRFIIRINPSTEAWNVRITGTAANENITGTGWEELLKNRHVDKSSREYSSLLTEWVAMKNSNTSSQASTKTTKEKFKELTDYMIANANFVRTKKVSKAEVVRLDDYGFTYKEAVNMNGQDFILTLLVGYGNKHNPASTAWKSELYMNTDLIKENKGNGIEELLQTIKGNFKVPTFGTPEYKSLTESISSIAEDFKAYENLWD